MIRLKPFRALPPDATASTSGLLENELGASGGGLLPELLGGWRRSEEGPAFHLLEASVTGPQRSALPDPPVRFLLGQLAAGDALELLEQAAVPSEHPELEPVVGLVADTDGTFRGVLDEASTRVVRTAERRSDGYVLKLGRVEQGALTRRALAALEQSAIRLLSPVIDPARQVAAFVSLSEPGLRLEPVHRGLRGWSTFREDTFLRLVGEYMRVYELPASLETRAGLREAEARLASMTPGHAILAVLPRGRGVILRLRTGLDLGHIPAVPRNPTLRSLDLALLDALVLRTVLGVREPELKDHPNVTRVASLEALVASVRSGELQVGFGLNPPPAWEVRAVMEASAMLPPATFRLSPSLPSGFVLAEPAR